MRTVKEIRDDIIEASKNYQVVSNMAWVIMPDADHDVPGTDEVLDDLKGCLRNLYKELVRAISVPEEDLPF